MIYYGDSSCESDLDRYVESLKFLWRRRSTNSETPVIVNTMGWVQGQLRPWPAGATEVENQCMNQCFVSGCPQDLDSSFWWT